MERRTASSGSLGTVVPASHSSLGRSSVFLIGIRKQLNTTAQAEGLGFRL